MFSRELDEYIKFLSQRDTKNLTQKSLKTMEELGELSRRVLPYENAFATNHRMVTKAQLLEEVADTMLCLISIGHDIGATEEELAAMIERKTTVWAEKQEAELGLTYPIPYEIHITVEVNGPDQIEYFKYHCQNTIGVKPIVIELQDATGSNIMRDVMTSSKHFGDNNTVMEEVLRISKALKFFGLKVVREKVESVPWHPAAPRRNRTTTTMPKDCYFECHFAVILAPDQDTAPLDAICKKHALHRSRNAFKKYENGVSINMLTARSYEGTYEDFLERTEAAKTDFTEFGFQLEKEIIEFSVYDTRVIHDSAWISKEHSAPVSEPA